MQHAGIISYQQAIDKAKTECEKFKQQTNNQLMWAEKDFIKQKESIEKKFKPKNKKFNQKNKW